MRKGWFKVDGQDGDRTPEEQLAGLELALGFVKAAAANGKKISVLDLGCAEGAISREFALAGASEVVGIELLEDHIKVGQRICAGLPVKFVHAEMRHWIERNPKPEMFDVVLALGIAHKLHDPGSLMAFSARSAKCLVVFRGPGKKDMFWDGWLRAKFGDGKCHVPTLMGEHGFDEGITLDSSRGERVQHWWRSHLS